MPFINTKYSSSITPEQEESLKSALGKAISIVGKSESWLMLGFEQNCTLYFRGKKDDKIAFVEVSLFGDAPGASYDKLTGEICRIFKDTLGMDTDKIYIKYSPTEDWGWNGRNL